MNANKNSFDSILVKLFKQLDKSRLQIALMLLLSALVSTGYTQNAIVKGVITDARSGETLPFVSIQIAGTTFGDISDDEGNYAISIGPEHKKLIFTYVGYQTQEIEVQPGKNQVINIQLNVDVTLLNEVIVKSKARYRNRENPAVQLVRKVIEHKEENEAANNDYVEYEQYEKISFSMSNLSDKFKDRNIFKNYQFLFVEQDSTDIGGKNMLPAYMHEKISDVYFRKSPHVTKHWIKAEKKAEFDPKFVDNEGLSSYFNRLYEDVNIYQNDISIATNLLLSPIAGTAPTFYKFYIRDTIKTAQPWLIELGFVPRNKADLLFQGSLFVTLDGKYAVQYAYLTVHKDININFMRNLEATIEFRKSEDGRYYPARTKLGMEFSLGKKGGGLYGQRVVNLKDYKINISRPDSIYRGLYEELLPIARNHTNEDYWQQARHEPLEENELSIYKNIDTLQTIPSFRRTMSIATLFLAGYQTFSWGEIGPVNTFYSFNPIEGLRLRFGGRTTTDLSKRFYMESYAAYGFRDEKWKYFVSGTFSLNNKSVYNFPLHYIRLSYQKDTKIPGQELQFVQEDNFLLSFKRGNNMRWLYNDIYKAEYVREFPNNFSFKIGGTNWTQRPTGVLEYNEVTANGNEIKPLSDITTTEVNFELRYAPKEQFYQGKLYRTPIINRHPIYTLRYNAGLKGAFGGEYTYHNVSGSISKRFYLSQLGFADVVGEGGYIFGNNIPFPLLNIHRANQTYAYQLNSYNMMNFLEFVSDHYAALNVQYYMNGFLFNKIPLFKKLKWREVFSYKMVFGGLRDENNPAFKQDGAMLFPVDNNGDPISYTLNNKPYAEASVGIANIFKLLRVDLVKRLNYLDNPNVAEWGVRARFRLDF